MKILKRAGWGLLLWAIMFVWVTILMFGFKLESGTLLYILTWIGAIIAIWFLAGAAKVKGVSDGFVVGLIFVVVGLIMDWLVTLKFSPDLFSSYSIWIGYGLTLLIPILRGSMKK